MFVSTCRSAKLGDCLSLVTHTHTHTSSNQCFLRNAYSGVQPVWEANYFSTFLIMQQLRVMDQKVSLRMNLRTLHCAVVRVKELSCKRDRADEWSSLAILTLRCHKLTPEK